MKNYLFEVLLESLEARNVHRMLFAIALVVIMGYQFFATVAGVFIFNYCLVMVTRWIWKQQPEPEPVLDEAVV